MIESFQELLWIFDFVHINKLLDQILIIGNNILESQEELLVNFGSLFSEVDLLTLQKVEYDQLLLEEPHHHLILPDIPVLGKAY